MRKIVLTIPLLALALSACETTETASTAPSQAVLTSSAWQLVSINDEPISNPRTGDIRFDDRTLSGKVSCNSFSTAYTLAGDQLTMPNQMAVTQMACSNPAGAQEMALMELLSGTVSLTFPSDAQMEISGNGHKAVLERR